MADRDSRSFAEPARNARPVAAWTALDRGWQAVVLGVSIVLVCHLVA